jgi:hypothetical protein
MPEQIDASAEQDYYRSEHDPTTQQVADSLLHLLISPCPPRHL